MGISTTGSWLGTLCGTLVMASLAPLLASFALSFGSYEFFWIAVFGIVISGTLAGGDPLKGYMAGFLGLLVSTIGQDAQHAYPRFAFGSGDLAGGIGLLPALVGAFGLAEVLTAMGRPEDARHRHQDRQRVPSSAATWRNTGAPSSAPA